MKIDIRHNFPQVQRWLTEVGKQARYATSVALNNTAKDVQAALQDEIPKVFDRPTPYIRNSIRVTRWATRNDLEAVIEPKYPGGKGVDPQNVLRAEVFGGERKAKRSEILLRRAGILPPGYFTVPGRACPLDEYGNVKGSFLVQLISYFKGFGEQGFRANMTLKRKQKMSGQGRWINGRFVAAGARGFDPRAGAMASRQGGVAYFLSRGRAESGVVYGAGGQKLNLGRSQHLAAGIWSRSGLYGAKIQPILMFVSRSRYAPRYQMLGLGARVATAKFPGHFAAAFDQAVRTAR